MLTVIGKGLLQRGFMKSVNCYSVFVTQFTDVVMDKQLPLMWDENDHRWQLK